MRGSARCMVRLGDPISRNITAYIATKHHFVTFLSSCFEHHGEKLRPLRQILHHRVCCVWSHKQEVKCVSVSFSVLSEPTREKFAHNMASLTISLTFLRNLRNTLDVKKSNRKHFLLPPLLRHHTNKQRIWLRSNNSNKPQYYAVLLSFPAKNWHNCRAVNTSKVSTTEEVCG